MKTARIVLVVLLLFAAVSASAAWRFARTPSHAYLRTTSAPGWDDTGAFTVSLWFRAEDTSNSHTLLRLEHTGANERYMITADGAGGGYIRWRSQTGGSTYTASSMTTYSANTWHHVLARRNTSFGGTLSVSLDGAPSANSTDTPFPTNAESFVQISGDNAFIPALIGRVSDVAIWDVSFTHGGQEHQMLRKGFSPQLVRPGNLLFYAPLVRELQDVIMHRDIVPANDPVVAKHGAILY